MSNTELGKKVLTKAAHNAAANIIKVEKLKLTVGATGTEVPDSYEAMITTDSEYLQTALTALDTYNPDKDPSSTS